MPGGIGRVNPVEELSEQRCSGMLSDKMDTTRRIEDQAIAISSIILNGSRQDLEDFLAGLHSWDAAQVVLKLPIEEQKRILTLIRPEKAADVVEEMPDLKAAEVISELSPEEGADIVEEMESDEAADLLQDLKEEQKERILEEMEPEDRAEAEELLSYPEETAGGIMMKEFISFRQNQRVADVIEELRSGVEEYREFPILYLYVLDEGQRLQGVLPLRDLILRPGEVSLLDCMIKNPVSVPVDMDQEEVGRIFEQHHYLAIPVVDLAQRMIGVVTQDDALKIVEREASEDLLKFSGIVGGEETRDMPFLRRSSRRLAWLSVNILLNLVAAYVIWLHEDTLQAVIALAMFLPIISDMSGCSGNQAIAVSIRELAMDIISPKDFLRVWWKEASVGLLNGFVLGAQLGGIAYLWKISDGSGFAYPLELGLVVGVSLWLSTILSLTIGSLVPLLLKWMKKDPALASAPILTTLTDLFGFFLVLTLASKFLLPLVGTA